MAEFDLEENRDVVLYLQQRYPNSRFVLFVQHMEGDTLQRLTLNNYCCTQHALESVADDIVTIFETNAASIRKDTKGHYDA